MEAIKKQASKLREQVAKQQQVFYLFIFLGRPDVAEILLEMEWNFVQKLVLLLFLCLLFCVLVLLCCDGGNQWLLADSVTVVSRFEFLCWVLPVEVYFCQ